MKVTRPVLREARGLVTVLRAGNSPRLLDKSRSQMRPTLIAAVEFRCAPLERLDRIRLTPSPIKTFEPLRFSAREQAKSACSLACDARGSTAALAVENYNNNGSF